jgi:hypothetical protein
MQRPLAIWPALAGSILEINVPLGVLPHATPLPVGPANINNLICLLQRTRDIAGDVAECGVYQGASLVAMAIWARQQKVDKVFRGFDSFEGFAASIVKDQELGGAYIDTKRPGGMNDTSYELVAAKVAAFQLENVRLYKGFFENTLPLASEERFSFVHLDCDGYDAYRECLHFFYPRLNAGGIILLDEYDDPPWPGCNLAVDEFLAERPETLEVIAIDNYKKFYFVKQSEAERKRDAPVDATPPAR